MTSLVLVSMALQVQPPLFVTVMQLPKHTTWKWEDSVLDTIKRWKHLLDLGVADFSLWPCTRSQSPVVFKRLAFDKEKKNQVHIGRFNQKFLMFKMKKKKINPKSALSLSKPGNTIKNDGFELSNSVISTGSVMNLHIFLQLLYI